MGRDLYDQVPQAREVFTQADRALRFLLSHLIFEGPGDLLQQTINAQPAIATVSIAALSALQARLPFALAPVCVAGHSLGEYTALVAAHAIAWVDAIMLIALRARLMQRAAERIPGAMAAVLGLEPDTLDEICRQARSEVSGSFVTVANLNCPGQVVLSGDPAGLARALELAGARGARRVIRLPVSGAFHSAAMRPVAQRLGERINSAPLDDAQVPLVGNVSATPLTAVVDLRRELTEQLYRAVQWEACIRTMLRAGVRTFLEVGPGQVLGGLIRRTDPTAEVLNVGTVQETEQVAQQLIQRHAA